MRRFVPSVISFLLAPVVCALPGLQNHVKFSYRTVSPDLITRRLQDVARDNRDRADRLKELFIQAGCATDRLTLQDVRQGQAPNVICTLPGTTGNMIIVGGHSDHVESGLGVVDDWSGASLLPSLHESLMEQPHRHTFVFVGFTAEEKGRVGSKYFIQHLLPGDVERIRAMINLECLGMAATEVWASHADSQLLSWFGSALQSMQLPLVAVNVERVGYDDAMTFRDRKVPTITLHSLTQGTLGVLHSAKDNYQAINSGHYYASYRLIASYLALLDGVLD